MKLSRDAAGVFPIAPTPFLESGEIDEASIGRLAEAYIAAGASGLTILGIMGEASKLEPDESVAVAEHFIKEMPNLPVIVGVSAAGFAAMRRLTNEAMDRGAAGVMIAPIPSLRTDEQIVNYYRQAVSAIGSSIPFVIQDYPLTLGVHMTPKVIQTIVNEHESCVMLKHEDWPGLEKISKLRAFQAEGSMPKVSILTGYGGLFLDFEMERGADGAMTGYAFPELLVEVVELQSKGQRDHAHDLFDAHLPLMRYEQQLGIGLAVRKYTLMRRGLLASDAQRIPGTSLTDAGRKEVDYLLSRLSRTGQQRPWHNLP